MSNFSLIMISVIYPNQSAIYPNQSVIYPNQSVIYPNQQSDMDLNIVLVD